MKKIGAIQSNYIPWKGYLDFIQRVDEFYLYDCVQYTSRNWRNRNCIKTKNGLKWLTIPLVHGRRSQKICEKVISKPHWNTEHWSLLLDTYAKTPYFNEYKELIKSAYLECRETSLSQINLRFLTLIKAILGITTPLILLDDYEITGDKNDDLIRLCKQAKADVYLTGPTTKAYFDEARFNAAGIKVEWMEYDYPSYNQLHPPFIHKVTILDLLFNEGPRCMNFIKPDR